MIGPVFTINSGDYVLTIKHYKDRTEIRLGDNWLCDLWASIPMATININKAYVVQEKIDEIQAALNKLRGGL